MKQLLNIFLIVGLIAAGLWGYSHYRAGDSLEKQASEGMVAMDQNFSLMLNGWNFSQAQMLIAAAMNAEQLAAQMDYLRQTFGPCTLNAGYLCDPLSSTEIHCRFDMTCKNVNGSGEVTWIDENGTWKVHHFNITQR